MRRGSAGRPQRPGFSSCEIRPNPVDLKWFNGKVPTPHGEIAIEAERDPTGWRLAVDVPPGIRPSLDIENLEPVAALSLNGQVVDLG